MPDIYHYIPKGGNAEFLRLTVCGDHPYGYTHRRSLVNCKKCKKWIKNNPIKKRV